MRKKYWCLIAAPLLAAALTGCGSGGETGSEPVGVGTTISAPPPEFTTNSASVSIGVNGSAIAGAGQNIEIIGASICMACHSDADLVGADKVINVKGYLAGKHVTHSTAIDQETAKAEGCKVCHDPIGDGPVLESYLAAANVPDGGLAAVTCEVCHGAGGGHNGVGPIPDATPDYERCGQCHNALPVVAGTVHPSANIYTDYKAGKHFQGAVRSSNPCQRCHTDEGFRTYIGETFGLDFQELVTAMAGKPSVGSSPLQCRTCHDAHTVLLDSTASVVNRDSSGTLLTDTNGNRITAQVFSRQFNLCTSCHQAFLNYIYDSATGQFTYLLDGTRSPYLHPTFDTASDPLGAGFRTIWDTHFKYLDPNDGTTVLIPGYNINAAAENPCTACHDPHSTSI